MVDSTRFKVLLLENNIKQKQLSEILDIREDTLNKKINNSLTFTVKEINILVKELNIKKTDIGKIFFKEN